MFKLIDFNRATTDLARGLDKYGFCLGSMALSNLNSLTLLPDNDKIKQLVRLYEYVLFSNGKLPVCYIPDAHYVMDETIHLQPELTIQIQDKLNKHVPPKTPVKLFIAKPNRFLPLWLRQLNTKIQYGRETKIYLKTFAHKGIFHRHIMHKNVPALIEKYPTIRVPKGYVANTKAEIQLAFETLKAAGTNKIIAKPIYGSLGQGIEPLTDIAQIKNFQRGPYTIEEMLDLDTNSFGVEANCAVGFHQKKVFAQWIQLFDGPSYVGAVSPFVGAESIQLDINRQTACFLALAHEYGMKNDGGIDFLISEGKPYLVDNNTGRITATHPAIFFQANHAPHRPFCAFAVTNKNLDVASVWDILVAHKVAFDKTTGQGVFPYSYMQGQTGKMISFHNSPQEAHAVGLMVQELLR